MNSGQSQYRKENRAKTKKTNYESKNFLLSELAKCNLAPNKSKFQLYATSAEAAAEAPGWLPRPFHITDDELRESAEKLDAEATTAATAAKRATPTHRAFAGEDSGKGDAQRSP